MSDAAGRMKGGRPAGRGISYFFYGTLMDADVRTAVIGRRGEVLAVEPAWLSGYRRLCMHGASYPVLVPVDTPAHADLVDGLLVHGISLDEERRLVHFEGPAYVRREVTAERRWGGWMAARCFLPSTAELADPRPWDFARWRRQERSRFLSRIRREPVAARSP